jgi:hypothetical protein
VHEGGEVTRLSEHVGSGARLNSAEPDSAVADRRPFLLLTNTGGRTCRGILALASYDRFAMDLDDMFSPTQDIVPAFASSCLSRATRARPVSSVITYKPPRYLP